MQSEFSWPFLPTAQGLTDNIWGFVAGVVITAAATLFFRSVKGVRRKVTQLVKRVESRIASHLAAQISAAKANPRLILLHQQRAANSRTLAVIFAVMAVGSLVIFVSLSLVYGLYIELSHENQHTQNNIAELYAWFWRRMYVFNAINGVLTTICVVILADVLYRSIIIRRAVEEKAHSVSE